MPQIPTSTERFRASKLTRGALDKDAITPGARLRITRPLDAESLIGRHEGGVRREAGADSLSARLQKRIGSSRALARAFARGRPPRTSFAFDSRQRAVVKLHYFGHAKGGGAALRAHARYIARDSAAKAENSGSQELRRNETAPPQGTRTIGASRRGKNIGSSTMRRVIA